jgi:hypothetical protein
LDFCLIGHTGMVKINMNSWKEEITVTKKYPKKDNKNQSIYEKNMQITNNKVNGSISRNISLIFNILILAANLNLISITNSSSFKLEILTV